jgi:hypothetical protein
MRESTNQIEEKEPVSRTETTRQIEKERRDNQSDRIDSQSGRRDRQGRCHQTDRTLKKNGMVSFSY